MNEVEPPINSLSLSFEEALYANYLRDPDSVSPDWRQYFDELSHSEDGGSKANGDSGDHGNGNGNGHKLRLGPKFRPASFFAAPPRARGNGDQSAAIVDPPAPSAGATPISPSTGVANFPIAIPSAAAPSDNLAILQDRVDQLIRAYRVRGHLVANLDPLGLPRPELPELDPRTYHFTEADMDRSFSTDTIDGPAGDDAASDHRAAAQHLLPFDRRAVHAHGRSDRPPMAARCGWKAPKTVSRSAAASNCESSRV